MYQTSHRDGLNTAPGNAYAYGLTSKQKTKRMLEMARSHKDY